MGPENAKPLFAELCRAVWSGGGHVLRSYAPADDAAQNLSRDFYELASDEQLDFFPEQYYRGEIDQADHLVFIKSDADPHALRDVPTGQDHAPPADPHAADRVADGEGSRKPLQLDDRAVRDRGDGRRGGALDRGLLAADHRRVLSRGARPRGALAAINDQITAHCEFLNSLPIDRLHVEGEDADLWITLGEQRKWIGGGGRNIPSFEVFTGPDWRGTEGRIRFSEPLYIFGSLIKGVELEFSEGRVVSASAEQNEELLKQMIGTEGADRIGEFSLTDARLSPIRHFMADTLLDENTGGDFGNTHLALGFAVRDAYTGDSAALSDEDWERLGFNKSSVHTDIVSTTDRTVTARLKDGSKRVIYAGGQFADAG